MDLKKIVNKRSPRLLLISIFFSFVLVIISSREGAGFNAEICFEKMVIKYL